MLVYESVSVSSCRCCMFVSRVHHVAVLNAALCMTCSLIGSGILQSRSHYCLVGSNECFILFTPLCCGECFYY